MNTETTVKVLFVCMGNICRSPTAHGVFQALLDQQNLSQLIYVDSAGTHSYHLGSPPDLRSQATAKRRGVDLSGLRARRLVSADFIEFDYLLGMDRENLLDMQAIRPDADSAKLELMLTYSERFAHSDVPDPYYQEQGFEQVYEMIDDASQGLLREIKARHGF